MIMIKNEDLDKVFGIEGIGNNEDFSIGILLPLKGIILKMIGVTESVITFEEVGVPSPLETDVANANLESFRTEMWESIMRIYD